MSKKGKGNDGEERENWKELKEGIERLTKMMHR